MTEATRILKYNNNYERIFAILVRDTLCQNDEYEIFWKDKALKLLQTRNTKVETIIKAIDFSNEIPSFFEKLNNIKYLEINLSDFESGDNAKPVLKKDVQQRLAEFTSSSSLIKKLKE